MFGTLSPTLLTAPYDVHKLFSAAVYSAMLHSHLRSEAGEMKLVLTRVSYRGGGGPGISPPPPPPATISQPPPPPPPQEILKLSMVIIVLSQILNNNLVSDCVRSNLRGSKFKIFLGKHDPRPLPSRHTHTYVCVSVLLRATIILLPSCFPPPPPLPTQNPV